MTRGKNRNTGEKVQINGSQNYSIDGNRQVLDILAKIRSNLVSNWTI